MTSSEAKNEMLVMVPTDLAAICNKLARNPAVPEGLGVQAGELVAEFDSLLPVRGKATSAQHYQAELLIGKIARFLPRLSEVRAYSAVVPR